MKRLWRRRPSPAMVVALIALIIALGGTAAGRLIRLVSGDSLIRKHSLSGNRLRKHTLTGTEINMSKLGVVPGARHASTADFATRAGSASTAAFATGAGSANTATTAGSAPPVGTAGGDLSGSYPSPTIATGVITASMLAPSEPWHEVGAPGEPTLVSDCMNRGGSSNTVAFYRDPLGVVHLKGQVAPTPTAALPASTVASLLNTNGFFRLPAGYRPAAEEDQAVDNNFAPSGVTNVPLNVKPDGRVTSDSLINQLNAEGGTPVPPCAGTMSFDGVTFRAAG